MKEFCLKEFETYFLFDPENWSFHKTNPYPYWGLPDADFCLDLLPPEHTQNVITLLQHKYSITAKLHEEAAFGAENIYTRSIRVAATPKRNETAMLEAAFMLTNRSKWLVNKVSLSNQSLPPQTAWNLPLFNVSAEQCVYLVTQLQACKIPFQLVNSRSLARGVLGDKAKDITIEVLRVRGDGPLGQLMASFPSLKVRYARRPPSERYPITMAASL